MPTTTEWFGHEQRLRLEPPSNGAAPPNKRLVELVARGFALRDQLLAVTADELASMPVTQHRHLERTARLAYLAPDIVRAIVDGRQPKTLTARSLARLGSLPMGWAEQRTMLGFAAD